MCDTAPTSSSSAFDARTLLQGGPGEYTARRDALAKELRGAGDKDAAAEVKALTRPTMSLWAVLVAGADADLAREAMDATAELVRVQGQSSDRAALTSATTRRRAAMELVVAQGTKGLSGGSDARTQEVRDLVERLTRHPELLDAWLDATLRVIPEEGLGFDAFAAFEPPPDRPRAERAERASPPATRAREATVTPIRAAKPDAQSARDERARAQAQREREQVERAARAAAKAELTAAERAVTAARRTLEIAQRTKDAADEAYDRATAAVREAEERRDAARAGT